MFYDQEPYRERWPDASLRPALEDWLGAGAVIQALGRPCSPEAQAAANAFRDAERDLPTLLKACSSGRELRERGFEQDVELAGQFNVSRSLPKLQNGVLRAVASGA